MHRNDDDGEPSDASVPLWSCFRHRNFCPVLSHDRLSFLDIARLTNRAIGCMSVDRRTAGRRGEARQAQLRRSFPALRCLRNLPSEHRITKWTRVQRERWSRRWLTATSPNCRPLLLADAYTKQMHHVLSSLT